MEVWLWCTPPLEQGFPYLKRKNPVTYLTIEHMSLQEVGHQTHFQISSYHMEVGKKLCQETMVPALELERADGIH